MIPISTTAGEIERTILINWRYASLIRLQYQELFGICQALPGPGSTKMVFCIAMIRAGIIGAIFSFLLWSLPGAIGMYGLSLGVQQMPDRLPPAIYAMLSGLNASTVGIVALAAVQVSLRHDESMTG
jgi:chromate transport protein ChrA